MKVQKSAKKQQPPPKDIASLIERIAEALKADVKHDAQAQHDLVAVLGEVTVWTYPRGDLTNWISILDSFDEVMESYIATRKLGTLAVEPFTDAEKQVTICILNMLKLLLVNCTSRKLFASYDRLGSLLYSFDLEIVEAALLVLVRPTMQYSSTTPFVLNGDEAIQNHLRALSAGFENSSYAWEQLRELGWDMQRLATDPEDFQWPPEQRRLRITTQRQSSAGKGSVNPSQLESPTSALRLGGPETPSASSSLVTPQRPTPSTSTPKRALAVSVPSVVDLGDVETLKSSQSVYEVTKALSDKVTLQPEGVFSAICKIRFMMAMSNTEARKALVNIRLLALATFTHIQVDESQLQTFVVYNPELVPQIAHLVPFDKNAGHKIQASALICLEALARNRPTTADVLTALNANVNHGVLFTLIKGVVKRLTQENADLSFDFVDSVIAMISMLTQTPAHAGMMITAGIMALLLELLQSSSPTRASFIPRASGLIDSIIYGAPNAFQYFCQIGGLDTLNQRIQAEIDMCLKEDESAPDSRHNQDTVLFYRVSPLKAMLRSVHRMMQSSGTTEGLRNLIDSDLPKSLKRIYQASDKLGPVVFGLAINLMATFVHNEPTSLGVLQELELPQMLYERVAPGLVPSLEVVCAVPNAIGAICLNQTGLDMTLSRPELIENVVNIMISPEHDIIMSTPGNPRAIGASLDELVRHHPALRPILLQAVFKLLQTIVLKGGEFTVIDGQAEQYDLQPKYLIESKDAATSKPSAVTMESNPIVYHFTKVFGLLEGLFHQPALCNEFLDADGISRILECIDLACIPTNFSTSPAASSIIKVLRVISQIDGARLLDQLSDHVDKRIQALSSLVEPDSATRSWDEIIEFASAEDGEKAIRSSNAQTSYRRLCQANTTFVLFADSLSYISQQQGRLAPAVLNALSGPGGKRLQGLGQVQRVCTRQAVALQVMSVTAAEMVAKPVSTTAAPAPESPVMPVDNAVTIDPLTAISERQAGSGIENLPLVAHLKPLRLVAFRISATIGSMLQGSLKALSRRHIDRAHGQAAEACSLAMSSLLIANIHSALPKTGGGAEDPLQQTTSYRTFVVGSCSNLLFDDRNASGYLQLPLYLSFQDQGGVGTLAALSGAVIDTVENLMAVPKDDRSKQQEFELVQALANLQQTFSLLRSLVSTKSLVESPQAAALVQREIRESEQKLFPHVRLVKVRQDVLPSAARLWNAPWLGTATPAVMRVAAQTFLQIMGAQREDAPQVSARPPLPSFVPPAAVRQPVVADPARIDQLAEMGFTRQQAENALLRTRNNVALATEFLLTTPHLFAVTPPPAPAPALPAADEPSNSAEPASNAAPTSNAEPVSGSAVLGAESPTPAVMEVDKAPSTVLADHDSTLSRLNSQRDACRTDMAPRAIALIDDCEDLVFDIRSALPAGVQAVDFVLERAEELVAHYTVTSQKTLAGRLRLLAVVSQGASSESMDVDQSTLQRGMRLVMTLIDMPLEPPPRWLAAALLVAESLLSQAERIASVDVEVISPAVVELAGLAEGRALLVRISTEVLRVYNNGTDTTATEDLAARHEIYLAVLRLLVILTRRPMLAKAFSAAGGVPLMLATFQHPTNRLSGCHPLVTMIMRHLVEDESVLKFTMRTEIKRWLAPNRNKVADASHFLRQVKQVALRSPEVFLEAVTEECALVEPEPAQQVYHIRSRLAIPAGSDPTAVEALPTASLEQMQVDDPFNSAVLGPSSTDADGESVLSFLFGEIHTAVKLPADPATTTADKHATGATEQLPEPSHAATPTPPLAENSLRSIQEQRRTYACLLMQLLTELVGSYLPCKTAFLATRRRRDVGHGSGRPRPVLLSALINDWVCGVQFEDFVGPSATRRDEHAQTRLAVSSWACSAVVALCADVGAASDLKESSPELVTVRKIVLDFIAKAIKDVGTGVDESQRYGKLSALADLVLRLLTTKSSSSSSTKIQDDSVLQVAKIMLEKNYVGLLTTALSEVDLEFPNIKSLLATVIRPLEQLSKISIKMGKAEKKSVEDEMDVDASSSSGSSSEGDGIEEEELSDDLEGYRNSSLAMYTMGASDDDLDEDADEDSEEGFDEEMGPDPDSDETSDEDDDMDEGGDIEDGMMGDDDDELDWSDDEDGDEIAAVGDGGAGFAFEEEGDLMGHDSDDDDGHDEHDEEDMEGEFGGDLGDEGDDIAEMDMDMDMDMDEEGGSEGDLDDDDAIALEDMERFAEDLGYELDHSDPLAMFENPGHSSQGLPPSGPWGWVQGNGASASRTRNNMLDRAFNGVLSGAETPATSSRHRQSLQHPLLMEPATNTAGARRAGRGQQGVSELVNNIENLLGHEAAQTLERLITQGRLNGADAIRIDLAQDEGGDVRVSVGGRQMVVTAPESSSSLVSPSGLMGEFVPKPTLQRWLEELHLVHGAAAAFRLEALTNHVVSRLLPEARRNAAEDARRLREEEALAQEKETQNNARAAEEKIEPITVGTNTQSLAEKATTELPTPAETPATALEPATQVPLARVTVNIHGRAVDITDTGIDLDFLEALPDEMRADVVEQHMREQARQQQRTPARAEPEVAPQINAEFLDALPPDIRAEVIQQEALEQVRRSQASSRAAPASEAPASFLASLDNDLRDVVLMDQTEAMLGTSETTGPGGSEQRLPPGLRLATGSALQSRKKAPERESIQLLDRQGVAALVRLLFFPEVQRTQHLIKVMVNLCQNSRTRTDLLDSMLTIVQDGPGEANLGDRSSLQSTPRGKGTPKSTPRRRPGAEAASSLSSAHSPTVPTFIAQRCLESLSSIVDANEAALRYFITEHDLPPGLRKATRKGKGKEKLASATFYPIASLLALFERPSLLQVSHILEALTSLLSHITKPLASLPMDSDVQSVAPVPEAEPTAEAPYLTTASSFKPTQAAPAAPGSDSRPVIPSASLRPVINVMTTGECSSRSFSHTLSLIQHLSHLTDARDVFVDELSRRIQAYGDALGSDLRDLAGILADDLNTEEERNEALASFSPASSTQAKLLRLLKTLDFMFSGKIERAGVDEWDRQKQIIAIYDGFSFGDLWARLSTCLDIVENTAEDTHVATVLLPLIEALMVVCKYYGTTSEPNRNRAATSPMSPLVASGETPNVFLSFTSRHRKILNTLVRNNPALMSGSFSLLVLNSKVLEFDNKRNWFYQKLKRKREVGGVLQLNVRRQYVFEDSFQMLQRRTGDEIKFGKLSIKFHGEDGVDAGGVTREWYSVLAKQIFDPNFALFEPCHADQLTYQPNKSSGVNNEHLAYFKFVGRVIGKAVFDNRLLDAYFSRAFYKQILGKPVDLRDLESIDPDYHKSLLWMLDNDITGVVDNEFTTDEIEFGETKTVELKPGGAQIPVTQENKEEYVRLMVSYLLSNSIKEQIAAFLSGFYDIIPQHLVQIFQPDQLELLISGISTIDVDELKNATQLHGWKNSDPEITWFWRALRSFSQEERAHFLMFVTSSSRVPLGGFSQLQGASGIQPFQIHKLHSNGALPSAATCFNLLKLGSYPNYETLRAKLLFAMYEGGGFGLA